MINAIIVSSEKYFSDDMLISIAEIISIQMNKKYDLPGLFSSDLSREIENMIMKKKN